MDIENDKVRQFKFYFNLPKYALNMIFDRFTYFSLKS